MPKTLFPALALILGFYALMAQDKRPMPAQAQRGRDLFVKYDKGMACGTCHELAGTGTAVGPDLKTLGSAVGPHGLVMAMRMTMTAYVQEVKLADGSTFPGMLKQKQGDDMEIWDLSQDPPALRKLTAKQVSSMTGNTKWKHPPASIEYDSKDLADIVGFIKWAATGSAKVIKTDDVEDAK
jgi:hypothetical protein